MQFKVLVFLTRVSEQILPQSEVYNNKMATWLVHLRIAENLLQLVPELISAPFTAGNIAPDSGIPDEKWENFNPPSQVTHFQVMRDGWNHSADLDFHRRYLLPLLGGEDMETISFRLGYFCHLVTDNLWGIKIGKPTMDRWAEQFSVDKDFIWEVKKDWYGLDFRYLYDHPDYIFQRLFLTIQAETGGLDFLPLEAVKQRIEYIQQLYQHKDDDSRKKNQREYIYLSAAEMNSFVDETTQRLFCIYQKVWVKGCDTGNSISALDLIE